MDVDGAYALIRTRIQGDEEALEALEVMRAASEAKAIHLKRCLSYTELAAIRALDAALGRRSSGVVVAAQVMQDAAIHRTTLTAALRKLQAAGVLYARSMGCAGTRVEVVDRWTFRELVRS